MNYKFPKFKSGFSIIEILIVTSVAVFLTSVTLAVRSNSSAPKDVDSAAQQIAAQLRALQGDALNGKEVLGVTVCGFKMDTSALTSYTVSYYDCATPTPNLITTLPAVTLKNVTTNSINVTFQSPYGETGNIYTIEITSNKDATIKRFTTINSIGSVEVLGDASAVGVVACNYSYTEGPCLSGSKTLTNPVGTPAGCVGVPETTRACVSSVFCTGNYSNTWLPATCPISGTQTKNLISLSPAGCIDGGSVPATISQTCTYIPPPPPSGPGEYCCASGPGGTFVNGDMCESDGWSQGQCASGTAWTYIYDCTSGNYSNTWLPATCPISGTQTKTLLSLNPANCYDNGSVPATISQSCTYVPTCSDGIQNQGEIGTDCGGPNCTACIPPDWISGPCAFSVYKDDIASTRQWKTSNTICGSPQCPAGALSADNLIDFSQYPARDACKSLGGRLPSRTEATCIFNNRSSYGTFLSAKYWTSEQYSGASAWYIYMAPGFGNQSTSSKANYEYVRCIK